MTFSLCGCTPIFQKKVIELFEANVKNNQDATIGALSVYWRNHIYYYSDENGMTGIYQMNCDGSQAELITECRDIKKLQIKDGLLYFLEYDKEINNREIATKSYRLNSLNLETGEKKTIEIYATEQGSYGLWDFCVGDSNIVFTSLWYSTPTQKIEEATGIRRADGYYLKSLAELSEISRVSRRQFNYYLYNYDNWYIAGNVAKNLKEDMESPYVDDWAAIGIYEKEQKEPGFLYHAEVYGSKYNTRILYQGKDRLLITNQDALSIYNIKEKCQENREEVEGVLMFRNAVERGKHILLLATTKRGTEKILCMDIETGILEEIYETSKNSKIIYLNAECYTVLEENSLINVPFEGTVNKWNITKNIIKKGYKTDMCGDWLFITHWDARKKIRKLDYKINMKNIENTIIPLT